MEIIPYTPATKVLNAEALPNGTGAPYLECIRDHKGNLVAKAWRTKKPASFEVLLAFIR